MEFHYTIQIEISYSENHVASLALIKRFPTIEVGRPLQLQLQLLNLPGPGDGGNAYEALHAYVHNAIAPFFDAYVSAKAGGLVGVNNTGREDKDSKAGGFMQ